VILLHEEGVNIPTNLSGVAYVPYPKDNIEAGFHVLQRELKALYNLSNEAQQGALLGNVFRLAPHIPVSFGVRYEKELFTN
jgi:hypothetical protein